MQILYQTLMDALGAGSAAYRFNSGAPEDFTKVLVSYGMLRRLEKEIIALYKAQDVSEKAVAEQRGYLQNIIDELGPWAGKQ